MAKSKHPPISDLRNIGIIAHIDAGKTTTTERILYYTEASHKMGDVDSGNTSTDFDEEEAERGITIYSAAVSCRWRDKQINLIDTPGHVDFTAEVERSLRVLDGGVVVFSAVEGVEAQSETVWRQARKYSVPLICFINKMDRIGADFDRTIEAIKTRLEGIPAVITFPIGAGHDLKGIVDVIRMKAIFYEADSKGKDFRLEEIPEEERDRAEFWRSILLDQVAELDDEVMEQYLETGELDEPTIHSLLRKATLTAQLQPLFAGASLDYIGVQPILDAVVDYLPSPLDVPSVIGRDIKNEDKQLSRNADEKEPFTGLIFKIQVDQHNDMCFLRVYSGTLPGNARMLNPRTGKKEFVTNLWHIQADRKTKVEAESVRAGDIVGVVGPREVVTGDTLCDPKHPIVLESITFPETVISMAVEPETSAERKKLADTLDKLSKQDPTFNCRINEETGQTIISGMGELHLEVIRHRMERDFNLKVRVHKPRVSYRETIRNTVEHRGEFQQRTAEQNLFAAVTVRVEPAPDAEGVSVRNRVVKGDASAGSLNNEQVHLLTETVQDVAGGGGMVGYPLTKVAITILGVETRDGETTETSLQAAANKAVRQALDDAGAILLEPIMKLEVVTPEDFLGNIQADLNSRRAIITASEQRGDLWAITSEVSLAQMFGYSTQVRSLSQGRAGYSMEPLKYAEAPKEVMQEMMY